MRGGELIWLSNLDAICKYPKSDGTAEIYNPNTEIYIGVINLNGKVYNNSVLRELYAVHDGKLEPILFRSGCKWAVFQSNHNVDVPRDIDIWIKKE
jgi:hypothetical protein